MVQPDADCRLCPRLAAFRDEQRTAHPDWYNRPVAAFGDPAARLLIAGLAPGLKGANRTGRPFTGDFAGDLLYATLGAYGYAQGTYDARPDDGLTLTDCLILNAVRCVPPENKPTTAEIRTCNAFFADEITDMKRLRCIIALGRIAHDAVLSARGLVRGRFAFAHNARHDIGDGLWMVDSYHCSRYNTNTGRLTEDMFHQVFETVGEILTVSD